MQAASEMAKLPFWLKFRQVHKSLNFPGRKPCQLARLFPSVLPPLQLAAAWRRWPAGAYAANGSSHRELREKVRRRRTVSSRTSWSSTSVSTTCTSSSTPNPKTCLSTTTFSSITTTSSRHFLKTGFAIQLVSRLSSLRPSVGSHPSTSRQPREQPSPRPEEPRLGDRRWVVAHPARPCALVWSPRGLSRVAIGRPGRRGKGPIRPSSSTRPRLAISGQVLIVRVTPAHTSRFTGYQPYPLK